MALKNLSHRIATKLIFVVGLMLLVTISGWAYFIIKYQKEKLTDHILEGTDKLTDTIKLGAHYAMMLNSRDDINQIIQNIAKLKEIENIRIYNKEGEIKYSNSPAEMNTTTNIKDEACYICHRTEPPLTTLELKERTRIFHSPGGYRLLGIISPIRNEPGCASDCHVHPEGKQILGALDVVVSLEKTDREIILAERWIIGFAVFAFLVTAAIIMLFVLRFVNRPIRQLIQKTKSIAKGDYEAAVDINQDDEMGQLAGAINKMGREIEEKQVGLNRQRDEYQDLFERVPCLITVQNREYKLLRYNQEFAEKFNPKPGDYCYHAYKSFTQKCKTCPVEMTFADGNSHYAEETGVDSDGTEKHWIVRTSPIFDENGEVTAAMEISLDITERKKLEVELEKSEKKYHDIFNNIPNPVFMLDIETLEILDCNMSVDIVYGFGEGELVGRPFTDLFLENEKEQYAETVRTSKELNQIKQVNSEGGTIFVNIRISPSEYSGRKVFLVTTSDITKRLEAEQQLIQAGKMATLGEMATGVAHELNQPLSVIKTVSSFFIDKMARKEPIGENLLYPMLGKVDTNVDRATKIIDHMRQFARKSELELSKVQVNDVLENAVEVFRQQFKVRGIDLVTETEKDLPKINADPSRLEQVFVNLLINARDAIEEKWKCEGQKSEQNRITILTCHEKKQVHIQVIDTGPGIPKAISDKIFEPFFTTKEVGKGTGLGLSISYGIVKECGGTIEAGTKEGGGACFSMKFPINNSRRH